MEDNFCSQRRKWSAPVIKLRNQDQGKNSHVRLHRQWCLRNPLAFCVRKGVGRVHDLVPVCRNGDIVWVSCQSVQLFRLPSIDSRESENDMKRWMGPPLGESSIQLRVGAHRSFKGRIKRFSHGRSWGIIGGGQQSFFQSRFTVFTDLTRATPTDHALQSVLKQYPTWRVGRCGRITSVTIIQSSPIASDRRGVMASQR